MVRLSADSRVRVGSAPNYLRDGSARYLIKAWVETPDGEKKQVLRRGYPTKKAAADALLTLRSESRDTGYVAPAKVTVGAYLGQWLAGLRLAQSTVASYRRNIRLHVTPHIGDVPLGKLTSARLDQLYRHLETEGRSDGSGGLSPRSVQQYVHTIIGAALNSAVEGGVLKVNVAKRAHPPTAKEARAEEMKVWTPDEIAIFFAWAQDHMDRELRTAFQVLLASGMRRGELLALRWRDLDLNGGTVAVRRSVGTIKVKGESTRRHEGPTKNGKDRVVDLDPATVDLLREHRKLRAGLAFQLGTGEALVFGNEEGQHRVPETFSRSFADGLAGASGGRSSRPRSRASRRWRRSARSGFTISGIRRTAGLCAL